MKAKKLTLKNHILESEITISTKTTDEKQGSLRDTGGRILRNINSSTCVRKRLSIRRDFRIRRDATLVSIKQVTTVCGVHECARLRCIYNSTALQGEVGR